MPREITSFIAFLLSYPYLKKRDGGAIDETYPHALNWANVGSDNNGLQFRYHKNGKQEY